MPMSSTSEIPEEIKRLRLCSALRDCGKLGVEQGFKQSVKKELFVYDDQSKKHTDWSETAPKEKSKCFIVSNPDGVTLILLPLDGCIITGTSVTKGGVADCALLAKKELCLVEFKTNTDSKNPQTIEQRIREGESQLWHTFSEIIAPRCEKVSVFIDKIVDVSFFVVFDSALEVTSVSAAKMEMMTAFLEKHHYRLFFDNRKTF